MFQSVDCPRRGTSCNSLLARRIELHGRLFRHPIQVVFQPTWKPLAQPYSNDSFAKNAPGPEGPVIVYVFDENPCKLLGLRVLLQIRLPVRLSR